MYNIIQWNGILDSHTDGLFRIYVTLTQGPVCVWVVSSKEEAIELMEEGI